MFKKTLFFFVVLFFNSIYCQKEINSLQDSITKYYSKDFIKAKKFCRQLERKIEKKDNDELKLINYCYLADLSNALSQKDSVLYFFDKAMEIASASGEVKHELIVKINKANYFNSNFDFERALTIYDDCLKIAFKKDDTYAISHIMMQKANILYELEKYEESLVNYRNVLKNNNLSKSDIFRSNYGLVKNHIKLNKLDSAYYYIDHSLKIARKEKNKNFESSFLNLLSVYYRYKKDYSKAYKVIDEAILLSDKAKNELSYPELIISKAELLSLVNKNEESIQLLNDLLENHLKSLQPEYLCQIYYILSQNYKSIGQSDESNKYLNSYIDYSKKIGQKKIDTIDHLHKIDITELQAREANLINQKSILSLIILVLIGISVFVFFNKRKNEKINQLKFEELLLKINAYEENNKNQKVNIGVEEKIRIKDHVISYQEEIDETVDNLNADEVSSEFVNIDEEEVLDAIDVANNEEVNEGESSNFVIKDETVADILEKLIKLEDKKQFLRQDFTLHNVAKKLKTNTAYLSKIINSELGKSFSTYANELRINYIIIELKNNAKLRSYSINAIAEEIGYKSPESFTKYFKIATGLSPSVYIKKINEIK